MLRLRSLPGVGRAQRVYAPTFSARLATNAPMHSLGSKQNRVNVINARRRE